MGSTGGPLPCVVAFRRYYFRFGNCGSFKKKRFFAIFRFFGLTDPFWIVESSQSTVLPEYLDKKCWKSSGVAMLSQRRIYAGVSTKLFGAPRWAPMSRPAHIPCQRRYFNSSWVNNCRENRRTDGSFSIVEWTRRPLRRNDTERRSGSR